MYIHKYINNYYSTHTNVYIILKQRHMHKQTHIARFLGFPKKSATLHMSVEN